MKILILGIDGYIGWALAQYLKSKGHEVDGCDNMLKRRVAAETGAQSCIPQLEYAAEREIIGGLMPPMDAGDLAGTDECPFDDIEADAIVNLAQLPSAPYSMSGFHQSHLTQYNNDRTNLAALWFLKRRPDIHMVTIGTLGEYGTPNTDIPEGDFELEFRGRTTRAQFPRRCASLYHASKCHASTNCEFACRTWGLKVTDVMQGVVYGSRVPGVEHPSAFWVDECWGTVVNRFCAQAVIGHPLTVYGAGKQKRGFLPLQDSLRCIELLCENPPGAGEYRVVNQFDRPWSISELATAVRMMAMDAGLDEPRVEFLNNPRVEEAEHHYNPDRQKLVDLGYEPRGELLVEVRQMLEDLLPHRERIKTLAPLMMPVTLW